MSEIWQNPLFSMKDRLAMAEGAVLYERSVGDNQRRLKEKALQEIESMKASQATAELPSEERERILKAAALTMPFTNPLIWQDWCEGHTVHTEADDIVAIWQAAEAAGRASRVQSEPSHQVAVQEASIPPGYEERRPTIQRSKCALFGGSCNCDPDTVYCPVHNGRAIIAPAAAAGGSEPVAEVNNIGMLRATPHGTRVLKAGDKLYAHPQVAPAAALYVRESELRRFQTQASELTVEWSLPVSKRPEGRLPLYVIAPGEAQS